MSTFVKEVCAACQSQDVTHDAQSHWNPVTQERELGGTYDDAWCHRCENECKALWLPLTNPIELASLFINRRQERMKNQADVLFSLVQRTLDALDQGDPMETLKILHGLAEPMREVVVRINWNQEGETDVSA